MAKEIEINLNDKKSKGGEITFDIKGDFENGLD